MEDVRILKELKKIYGDSVKFTADANQVLATFLHFWDGWITLKITNKSNKLYHLDIIWLEEPLYREDIDGYVRLRSKSKVLIACGELEHGVFNIFRKINIGIFDIVQYDAIDDNEVHEALTIY